MPKEADVPLTHMVSVARLPQRGMAVTLNASDAERAALARDHHLVEVKSFAATMLVSKWRRDGVKITGSVIADIVQTCSITLEPIDAHLKNEIDAVFVPEQSKLARIDTDANGEIVLDAEGPDMPETFTGDQLDIGRVAEEFFGLGIDLYPRKAGAELPPVMDADQEPAKVSPFAKLATLKQKQ